MKKHQISLENNHINDRLLDLCTSTQSVSSLISQDPTISPADAWEKLYGRTALASAENEKEHANGAIDGDLLELKKAEMCGRWGDTKPSELFLKVKFFNGSGNAGAAKYMADLS